MKTIMHPDYWVEIPAGECIIGLSMEQRESIWAGLLKKANYDRRPSAEQEKMRTIVEKWRQGEFTKLREKEVLGLDTGLLLIADLDSCPPSQTIWLDRFYITRFPITDSQFHMFGRKEVSSARELPGMLDTPESVKLKDGSPIYIRCKGPSAGYAEEFCQQLGARIPTSDEWEKAARGTDGRLYPWGNEWNPNAGCFYFGQKYKRMCSDNQTEIDAHPQGVSPYGVWSMMGGLAEQVVEFHNGEQYQSQRGWHPWDSSAETAPIHFLAAHRGGNLEWRALALRPVVDQWPVQQWLGISMDEIKLSPTPSKRSPSDNSSSQPE